MHEKDIIHLIRQALSSMDAPISSFVFACADDDGGAVGVAQGNEMECVGLAFHVAQRMSNDVERVKEEE